MTTCPTPATGANSSLWYIKEEVCGVTPDNPEFKQFRRTTGNMQLTKDTLESNELDGSRDRSDVRLGQNQATGEIGFEMSYGSHDDFYIAAVGGDLYVPSDEVGLTVTVDATAKTFTRDAGDYTSSFAVGEIVRFPDLIGANSEPLVITDLTATVLTAANVKDGVLIDETSVLTNLNGSDRTYIGDTCTSFTLLEHYPDLDSGNGGYTITRGVKVTAWSFNLAVNANNTGTFSMLGLTQEVNATLPVGTTFAPIIKTEVFSGVDGTIYEDGDVLGYVNSADSSLDTEASAQFSLGSAYASFIEQGRVLSSITLGTFFTDYTLLEKFVNETESSISLFMSNSDGAMMFTYPRTIYSSGAPDVSGPGSITQSLEALAMQSVNGTSSIIIQWISNA